MNPRDPKRDPDTSPAVPWNRSLGAKLSWAAILIVIIALTVTGAGLIAIAYSQEQQSMVDLQKSRADNVALLISSFTGSVRDELLLFEEITPLSSMTTAQQHEVLEDLLISRQTIFSQVTLLDKTGAESVKVSRFHTYLPGELGTMATDPGFIDAMNGVSSISPAYISPDSGLLSIRVTVPVQTKQDEITGALTSEVNVVRLWQKVSHTNVGDTGYAYLVDKNGRFIAYQESAEVLQNYGRDMTRMPPVHDFVAGDPGDAQQVYEYQGMTGDDVIGVYAPIVGTGWAVVTELPTKEAYASITRMMYYLEALIIISIAGTGLLVYVVSRRIVRPIKALTESAERMAAGDLNAEVVES
ncbi:MAG: HAMP domain-containing protein, partial [Methanomicrobiales archaeon]|nr:HAMP domain-containing protein [Methanomicrobiales archaeon]